MRSIHQSPRCDLVFAFVHYVSIVLLGEENRKSNRLVGGKKCLNIL